MTDYNDDEYEMPLEPRLWDVRNVGDRVPTQKSFYHSFLFETSYNGGLVQIKKNVFKWELGPVLDALGVQKNAEGKRQWSTDSLIGKSVIATPYRRDKFMDLKDFKAPDTDDSIPF